MPRTAPKKLALLVASLSLSLSPSPSPSPWTSGAWAGAWAWSLPPAPAACRSQRRPVHASRPPDAAGAADDADAADAADDASDSVADARRRSALMGGASLSFAASAALLLSLPVAAPEPAWAKDVDPTQKGTKADPAYQTCVSQCLYDCTKPKGDEQKSRAECVPECKKKCATSKQQLMLGTPKTSAVDLGV